MSETHIYTYHCLCTELILATFQPLTSFPTRKSDNSHICTTAKSSLPAPQAVLLSGSTTNDDSPVIIKLEDGFEKRYHAQCRRCDLNVAYRLDKSHFGDFEAEAGVRTDVLYIFLGGLMSTDDMKEGKDMSSSVELTARSGG